MNSVPISDLVLPVSRADPATLGAQTITYIDIASIDRESKVINVDSPIEAVTAPSRARQCLIESDVLVSTVRPNLNAVAKVPSYLSGSIGSTGLCVLRPNQERIKPDYLFYFTQTTEFISRLTRIANGASYPAVTDEDILDLNIILPTLTQQERIAVTLGAADRLRNIRRHALQMCDEFRSNAFREALNSREYAGAALAEICLKITDGVHITPTYVRNGIPFLRVTDIQSDTIDWPFVKQISRSEYEHITRRFKPAQGDILYSKNGTIGVAKEVTWSEPFAHFVSLALLRPNKERVSSTFLTAWLNTADALKQATRHSKTGTVTNLHLNEIEQIVAPLPSIPQQMELLHLLSNAKQLRAGYVEALRQADHLFQALLHQSFNQA